MCIVVDADLHVICLVVFCFAEFDGLFVMFFFFSARMPGCFVQCTSLLALLSTFKYLYSLCFALPVCRGV